MRRLIVSLTFVVLLISTLSCNSEIKKTEEELKQLEQQIQIEAYEFDKLLNEMISFESTKNPYPYKIDKEHVFPSMYEWGCYIPDDYVEKCKCRITIPVQKPVTIPGQGHSSVKIWGYSENIDGPAAFAQDDEKYKLHEIISNMIKVNPYHELTLIEEHTLPDFHVLEDSLQTEIDIIYEDIHDILDFVYILENKYFVTNEWCWDNKKELTEYRAKMDDVLADLSTLGTYLNRVKSWDYSNLNRYNELQDLVNQK